MPIPQRKQGQSEDTFIADCISKLVGEYPQDQAAAICYQQLTVQLTMDKEWRKSFVNSPESTCLTQYKHVDSNIK